jgi:hypothetical protein
MERLCFAAVFLMMLAATCGATPGVRHSGASGERLIDALAAASELRCTYNDDGAADSTVLENPVPEVLALLKLGPRLLPLLIRHLDDVRQTSARYDGGRFAHDPLHVSVGYVCLDILVNVVRTRRGIVPIDCADDGLGACVKQGYYFHPTVFTPSKDTLQQRKSVRVAIANWNAALKNGWLRFQYPSWLKRTTRSSHS